MKDGEYDLAEEYAKDALKSGNTKDEAKKILGEINELKNKLWIYFVVKSDCQLKNKIKVNECVNENSNLKQMMYPKFEDESLLRQEQI